MPPVSRHLQCGITLYSNVKTETQIRTWDKGHGIDVVLILLLSIKTVFQDFFAVFTFGTLQNVLHRK